MVDKPTFAEYVAGAAGNLKLPSQRKYELNQNLIRNAIAEHPFSVGLKDRLQQIASEYVPGRPELLLGPLPIGIGVHLKSFESALDKTYRENVVFNRKYPEPPKDGWIDGANFYSRLNDIIRCTIVCKYLDGPLYVCNKLKAYCDELEIEGRFYPMNTERGYHSWHFYARQSVDIFDDEGGITNVPVDFEIHVTTQLADVLTALTHELYREERSVASSRKDDAWKWEPENPRFRSTYMGHTLHLLEGIIQTLKDDVIGGKNEEEDG